MHLAKLLKLLSFLTVLTLVMSASAQQIRFEDFSDPHAFQTLLAKNGTVTQATWNSIGVMRLTDGSSNNRPSGLTASSAWFNVPQPVTSGFTSYFKFLFHNPVQCCTPGDGLAFVIQNSSSTDSSFGATGGARTALGVGNGGLGYAGIPSSIAIEFDTAQDPWDPTANHVALQTCGVKTNTPVHLPGQYTIGQNHNVTSCLYSQNSISSAIPPLGVACGDGGCIDGIPVTVVVEYTGPPSVNANDPYHLKIYVDPLLIPGTHTPVATATAQIDLKPFKLDQSLTFNNAAGAAYVGFTAGYGANTQTTDVLAWEFTPHTPTLIQQMIQNGGSETEFDYGNHVYGVTYPPGFVNSGNIQMTVNAIPIDATTFFNTRLKNNTTFNNEQCITYLSTGGNCIVYEVTCQDMNHNNVSCPNPDENQLIDTRTTYATTDPVNAGNADYIKAPIGTNNWCSIFTTFQQDDIDPTTSGKGKDFSDFVATFKTGPGVDPMCPGSGNSSKLFRKLPQTNAAVPASSSQQEPGPAGANK